MTVPVYEQSIFRSIDEHNAALAIASLSPKKTHKKRNAGISKPKKNKITIPIHDIVRFMTVPQPLVAKKLGVSISTLKRRYYELHFGRWPINSSNGDVSSEEYSREQMLTHQEKVQISNMVNEEAHDEKFIDPLSSKVLQLAFLVHTPNSSIH
jgi:hypothetical protein